MREAEEEAARQREAAATAGARVEDLEDELARALAALRAASGIAEKQRLRSAAVEAQLARALQEAASARADAEAAAARRQDADSQRAEAAAAEDRARALGASIAILCLQASTHAVERALGDLARTALLWSIRALPITCEKGLAPGILVDQLALGLRTAGLCEKATVRRSAKVWTMNLQFGSAQRAGPEAELVCETCRAFLAVALAGEKTASASTMTTPPFEIIVTSG